MTPMPSPINALAPAESQAQIRHFGELGALAMETHPFTRLFYADYRTTSSRPCGWLDSFLKSEFIAVPILADERFLPT